MKEQFKLVRCRPLAAVAVFCLCFAPLPAVGLPALLYRGNIRGTEIVRHVGTRGDVFNKTPLAIVGNNTRMVLEIARIVGTGSNLPQAGVPIVHELIVDAMLRAAPHSPPRDYHAAAYIALFSRDDLVATLHIVLNLGQEQQQRFGSSAGIETRDLFELPEAMLEQVTRYEIRYYESADAE